MNRDSLLSRPPGFWRTVKLLLTAARRRATGRMQRQQALLKHRTGSQTNTFSTLATVMIWLWMAAINGLCVSVVHTAIGEAQRVEVERAGKIVVSDSIIRAFDDLEEAETPSEKKSAQEWLDIVLGWEAEDRARNLRGSEEEVKQFLRNALQTRPRSDFVGNYEAEPGIEKLTTTGPLPQMLASVILIGWVTMLIFQGEGLELDVQRRRYPHWEWLFSHPVRPGPVFLAEMLSPVAANPIYATGPIFIAFLYGSIYGTSTGVAALILIGVPLSLAAACVGKALEIGVMLRFPPRTRGALIGFMSWLGYATLLVYLVSIIAMPAIIDATAGLLRPVATAIPWPWFSWATGMRSDGSFSFVSGMLCCWAASAVMITGGVWFTVWGAQRGLAGGAVDSPQKSRIKRKSRAFFSKDPLYRKEVLWFLRDRGAVVQTILIPITVAAFELFNMRILFQGMQLSWRSISGAAVIVGTYFLWVLGPRSLASEGPALWLAQTWPRSLEDLLKTKAQLWFRIATILVLSILVLAIVHSPGNAWKVALIAVAWLAFGWSMAAKSVTLVSVSSSTGEPETIPKGRRWAATLGTASFSIGILSGRWALAIVGIVYSWLTAAAMWENFRARLPFLFDPWSEKAPQPPTLMHAMIAITAFVDGAAFVTTILASIAVAIEIQDGIVVAQALAVGLTAVLVWIITSNILEGRGVPSKEVWRWKAASDSEPVKRWWWSGEGKWNLAL